MAGYLNEVNIIGNLGADPESKSLQNGQTVVNMTVATSESWKDKSTGEKKEKTEWHRVVIWHEKIGDVAMDYLRKGSKVYISGKLETRKWQDKDGQDRYSTEVVLSGFDCKLILLGDPRGNRGGERSDDRGGAAEGKERAGGQRRQPAMSGGRADMDDEIPF